MTIVILKTPDYKTRAISTDQILYVEKIDAGGADGELCLIQLNNGGIAFQALIGFDKMVEEMRK